MARGLTIQVRVSVEEKRQIAEAAEGLGLTASEYLRAAARPGVLEAHRRSVALAQGQPVRSGVPTTMVEAGKVAFRESAPSSAEPSRGFRCPLPACRHQAKKPGLCPGHGHGLVPVRL